MFGADIVDMSLLFLLNTITLKKLINLMSECNASDCLSKMLNGKVSNELSCVAHFGHLKIKCPIEY